MVQLFALVFMLAVGSTIIDVLGPSGQSNDPFYAFALGMAHAMPYIIDVIIAVMVTGALFRLVVFIITVCRGGVPPSLCKVEHAGIVVADIIEYRCWKLHGEKLQSVTADYIWQPGQIAEGDIAQAGIYSYHTQESATTHACVERLYTRWPIVIGRVQVWGERLVCKDGSRSEYARIVGLDDILGLPGETRAATLQRLRTLYLEETTNV